MKDERLVIVENYEDVDIFLDKESEWFVYNFSGEEYRTRNLSSARGDILDKKKTKFEKEFFIKSYDGIQRFSSKMKRGDVIIGFEYGKYGDKREERKSEEELWPVTDYNKNLFEKSKKLIAEGWELIGKGKKLSNLLRK